MELKSLFIEPTVKTPQIDLNHLNGELIFSGRSIPENPAILYAHILSWVEEYIKNPSRLTNLRFNIEYFNTASSLWLARIVKALTSIENTEFTVLIHLYFHIDEYNSMKVDDLEETLLPMINLIGSTVVSFGFKIYGTDVDGKILKESIIFI